MPSSADGESGQERKNRGVVYVATGPRCLAEAVRSVTSLKRLMPALPATLFTDAPEVTPGTFDRIVRVAGARHGFIDKILPLLDSPYERTLFLDSDTFVCQPLDDLFRVLDRFDLAVCHDSWRGPDSLGECPDAFADLNTGVLLYRTAPEVIRLIRVWHDRYAGILAAGSAGAGGTTPNDQPSFRAELFASDVRFYVLPPEYNLTVWCPGSAGAQAKVVIVHGRKQRLPEIARIVNGSLKARVFVPSLRHLDGETLGIYTRLGERLLAAVSGLKRARRRLSGR